MEYNELVKSIENNEIRGEYLLIVSQKEIKVVESDTVKQYIVGLNSRIQGKGDYLFPIAILFYVVFVWFINAQTYFLNQFIEIFQGWGPALAMFVIGFFSTTYLVDMVVKKFVKTLNTEFALKSKELGFTTDYLLNQTWLNENGPEVKKFILSNDLSVKESARRWGNIEN